MFNSSLFSKPWFVCAIIFGCFAIITPRILLPMIKQLLGLNQPINRDNFNNGPASSHINRPNMFAGRGGGGGGDAKVPTETLRRQGPIHGAGAEHQGSSSSNKSMLAFILPVYTVGIAIYMVYTLCKVYGNKKQPKEQENPSISKKNANSSNSYHNNIQWDPVKNQFVFKQPDLDTIYADEDVNDDIDDYENLDKDYVKFVKEKRRKEKISEKQQQQQKASSPSKPSSDMNDLIIQMKESLNNINIRLAQSDKNKGPTDDDDLQSIKLQLAQTELQMAKVLQTIDCLATSSEGLQEKIKQNLHADAADGNENDDDEKDLHHRRHRHHRHHHRHHKSKSGKKYKHGGKKYADSSSSLSDESTSTSTSESATTTSSSESDESSVKSASSSESKTERKYKKSSKKTHSRHKKSSSNKRRHEKQKSKTKIEELSSSSDENNIKNETNKRNDECKASSLNDEILNNDDTILKKSNENIEQLNRYSSHSSSSDIEVEDKKTK